jgi:hypothetical protein
MQRSSYPRTPTRGKSNSLTSFAVSKRRWRSETPNRGSTCGCCLAAAFFVCETFDGLCGTTRPRRVASRDQCRRWFSASLTIATPSSSICRQSQQRVVNARATPGYHVWRTGDRFATVTLAACTTETAARPSGPQCRSPPCWSEQPNRTSELPDRLSAISETR